MALKTATTPAAEKVWRAVAGGAALQTAFTFACMVHVMSEGMEMIKHQDPAMCTVHMK
jgi:hypothetical protein